MESSASSWEGAFSLSGSDRERVARSCRLRHRHPSLDRTKLARICDHSGPLAEREAALAPNQSESVNIVQNPLRIVAKERRTVNGLDGPATAVGEPIPYTCKTKRAKTARKLAALTLNDLTSDHEARASGDLDIDLPGRGSHPRILSSENILDSNISATKEASATHTRVSVSTCTCPKQTQTQMEINDSEFDYEKLPSRLEQEFFRCDALELAPKLLGKFLRRDEVVLQITEVEAYRPNDSACHGRFGVTPRTAAMFGPAGHAYVYLCYGMHVMLNIVADIEGVGAAVLIRSCAPIAGLTTIQARRGTLSTKPILLTGPGKIGQALGLTTDWSSHPLYLPEGLELLDGPAAENIFVGPRVGIVYADPKDVAALWRFVIGDSPWISAPRNNLVPL